MSGQVEKLESLLDGIILEYLEHDAHLEGMLGNYNLCKAGKDECYKCDIIHKFVEIENKYSKE